MSKSHPRNAARPSSGLRSAILLAASACVLGACGASDLPKPPYDDDGSLTGGPAPGPGQGSVSFTAADHTPGYFRDMYRVLGALGSLDDADAAAALRVELAARLQSPGDLPELTSTARATLDALLYLALRTSQATASEPFLSRQLAVNLVHGSLGLDPARAAWNSAHSSMPAPSTAPGPKSVVGLARDAMQRAASAYPAVCTSMSFATDAEWDPGTPESVWVAEECEPDRWVGSFCEPDRWIEGECYSDWIAEDCDGGEWVDYGRYEYFCYSSDDCRYTWRSRWVYEAGSCTGGYYEEWCENDYFEPGYCSEGTFVPGACIPGHYEETYSGGQWSYPQAVSAPAECEPVRPAQFAIGVAACRALSDALPQDLTPAWRAAVDELLSTGDLEDPNEAALAAVETIFDAVLQD